MSSLTHIEKQKLERELRMGGGYVLAFSNRTFEEFFREVVGVEIYDSRFDLGSGSKANRMRAFWQVATDEQLRLLLGGLLEGWEVYSDEPIPQSARTLLERLLKRPGGGASVSGPQQEGAPTFLSDDASDRLIAQCGSGDGSGDAIHNSRC